MDVAVNGSHHARAGIHPLHAVLLAGMVPMYLAAVLSDLGYAASYEVQWTNFSSWLIAGGLVFNFIALLWAMVHLFRSRDHRGHAVVYFVVLLATWILGFINALIHAKDAWAAMPAGLVLSVIVLALAGVATWLGFSRWSAGGAR